MHYNDTALARFGNPAGIDTRGIVGVGVIGDDGLVEVLLRRRRRRPEGELISGAGGARGVHTTPDVDDAAPSLSSSS